MVYSANLLFNKKKSLNKLNITFQLVQKHETRLFRTELIKKTFLYQIKISFGIYSNYFCECNSEAKFSTNKEI